jgi:uncharacterized protein DUF4234
VLEPTEQPGTPRPIGTCIALAIITFGIYAVVWTYKTFEELRRATGRGLGGGFALLALFFVGPVIYFMAPHEVGRAYEDAGEVSPVTAITGFWVLLPLFGPLVWFVRVQSALNQLWEYH